MGATGTTLRRSRAWLFGWLSLVGPAGVITSLVLARVLRQPGLLLGLVPSLPLSLVSLVLGVAAVFVGLRDSRRPVPVRPRGARAGLAIASVGVLVSGGALVVVGSMLIWLAQYDA